MTDVLDEQLREHGRNWTATRPAPPPFDEAMARATAQRDHRVLLAVAAAAVVVLVAVGVPLVRSLGGNGNSTPAPAMRSATVVSPTSPSPGQSVVQDSVGPTIRELIKRARTAAIGNQDPDATAEAVRTTYRTAERVTLGGDTSSSPPGDTPVWVIQLHGTFTCNDCSIPPGAQPPTGAAIVLVLDARAFEGYDFALTKKPVDLTKLGKVVQLPM